MLRDPFAFTVIGKENFQKSLAVPWNGIAGYITNVESGNFTCQMGGVQEFVFIDWGCLHCCLRITASSIYTVWMAGNWLIFTSSGLFSAFRVIRWLCFPIYSLCPISRATFLV
jgi:hypothetical protein